MNPLLPSDSLAVIEQLKVEREAMIRDLEADHDGAAWCSDHTSLADRAVVKIWEAVQGSFGVAPRMALVATGGYGRRELAPYSDIDITVVPQEADAPLVDEMLRTLFRQLQNILGSTLKFEIGYAYRLVGDLPGLDPVTRTGLLDSRLVAGSQRVFNTLLEAFWESMPAGEFVLAKITERKESEGRFNDSPLAVEPHLKEGAGGLRSFQTANWIRAAVGERPEHATREYDTLLRMRNLLHRAAGRKQDVLTRQRQGQLCELYDFGMDALMNEVLTSLRRGQELYEETIERMREARIPLSESVISIRGEARVVSPADPGQAAVGIALATKLGLSVGHLPNAYTKELSGPAALWACSTGEATLRNLDRAGILAELLPELDACRTLVPQDATHAYTVFEHTMRLVRHLDTVGDDPFLAELKSSISDPEPLYLAALLHDVGKLPAEVSARGHSEEGADIAERVAARWNLADRTSELVQWLVREHLTMALIMRIRDIQSPATISEFASLVGSPERLSMLALLTWADIASVSDGAFTAAQGAYLRELTTRTLDVLRGEEAPTPESGAARRQLRKELAGQDVPEADVEAFIESLPAHYLSSATPELARLHLSYAMRARKGTSTIEPQAKPELGATEVTLCAPDRPGLLSAALGVFYAFDLTLQGIRACTTSGEEPVALDVFTVSFGGRPVPDGTWRQLGQALKAVVAGEEKFEDVLRRRGKDPDLKQNVLKYAFFEGDPQILELQAPRGRGMAYRVAHSLSDHGFNILSARVGQWAGHAAAAFYLEVQPNARKRIAEALSHTASSSKHS
jgi:[protein-PII] uridylyltransferase